MTTDSSTATRTARTTRTAPTERASDEGRGTAGRVDDARSALAAAGTQVASAVDAARAAAPEVVRTWRAVAGDVTTRIESGTDQQVTAGATISLGLAFGMLLGGAPRLLVALALLPVAAMGAVLVERGALAQRRPAA